MPRISVQIENSENKLHEQELPTIIGNVIILAKYLKVVQIFKPLHPLICHVHSTKSSTKTLLLTPS